MLHTLDRCTPAKLTIFERNIKTGNSILVITDDSIGSYLYTVATPSLDFHHLCPEAGSASWVPEMLMLLRGRMLCCFMCVSSVPGYTTATHDLSELAASLFTCLSVCVCLCVCVCRCMLWLDDESHIQSTSHKSLFLLSTIITSLSG